jgi:hypothetical protein
MKFCGTTESSSAGRTERGLRDSLPPKRASAEDRPETPVRRPLRASWRLTPTRSLPTRSGNDGQRGVAPPLRMGREQRGARCSCSTVAVRASASSANSACAPSCRAWLQGRSCPFGRRQIGRRAPCCSRRPFPRRGGQRRRGWIGHLIGANSTALRSSGGAVGAAGLCPRGRRCSSVAARLRAARPAGHPGAKPVRADRLPGASTPVALGLQSRSAGRSGGRGRPAPR